VEQALPVKVLTVVTVLLLGAAAVAAQQQRALLTIQAAVYSLTAVLARHLRFQVQASTEAVVEQARQAAQAVLAAVGLRAQRAPLTQAAVVVECQAILAPQVQRAARAW
jgi:hypothetical protein